MELRLKATVFACLALIATNAQSQTDKCLEPQSLVHASVSLVRMFDEKESGLKRDGTLGVAGSGFFISQSVIATIAHVPDAMHLDKREFKKLSILQGEARAMPRRMEVGARYLGVLETNLPEKLALVELRQAVEWAVVPSIRLTPLDKGERVVSVGYPNRTLSVGHGHFARVGEREGEKANVGGYLLFELADGNNRLVLDHGASGAPIFDCRGNVAAVAAHLLSTTMTFLQKTILVTPPWGEPNNTAVPASILLETKVR